MKRARLVVVAALALVACSGKESTPTPTPAADAGSPPSTAAGAVWKTTSTRVEVTSFSFFQGSTGYAKDRADLAPVQLAALDGLRTIVPPAGMSYDAASFAVRITDASGAVTQYRASQTDVRDSDESKAAVSSISYASLKPFLDTFHCLAGKGSTPVERKAVTSADPKTADLSKAVAFSADTGCSNGVFVGGSCSDTFFTFDVAAAATYDFISGECIDLMSLRLFTADGALLLEESKPGAPGTCFTLRHAFAPGSYLLELSKTNGLGCNESSNAGDTTLRIAAVK